MTRPKLQRGSFIAGDSTTPVDDAFPLRHSHSPSLATGTTSRNLSDPACARAIYNQPFEVLGDDRKLSSNLVGHPCDRVRVGTDSPELYTEYKRPIQGWKVGRPIVKQHNRGEHTNETGC